MSILEKGKLEELKQEFSELEIMDENFMDRVQEIVNRVIGENINIIGTESTVKTVDEALEDEKKGFAELVTLQEEGVIDELSDKTLIEELEELAREGIGDEDAEKSSIENEGLPKEKKSISAEDISEEILNILKEVILLKQSELVNTINEKRTKRDLVEKRDKLRVSKNKMASLQQKTKEYKGTRGKKLNTSVISAVNDLDKQLQEIEAKTQNPDGTDIEKEVLDKEIEEAQKKADKLQAILDKINNPQTAKDMAKNAEKNCTREKDNAKLKEVKERLEPKIELIKAKKMSSARLVKLSEDIATIIRQSLENSSENYKAILREYMQTEEVRKFTSNGKTNSTIKLSDIYRIGFLKKTRQEYILLTGVNLLAEYSQNQYIEQFDAVRKNIKLICGEVRAVPPLMTEQEHLEDFKKRTKAINKAPTGFLGIGNERNKKQESAVRILPVLRELVESVKDKLKNPNDMANAFNDLVKACGEKAKDIDRIKIDKTKQTVVPPVTVAPLTPNPAPQNGDLTQEPDPRLQDGTEPVD